ncbi:MAG: NAD-dependent succinate-semialdehyde dehydrogenase [Afipia sp.]|nr:NAD-dependent succinate-semialdehyde dehydrogenase [Afipia sp.]
MALKSINPTNGTEFAIFKELSAAEIDGKLGLAASTFSLWKQKTYAERGKIISNAAKILLSEKDKWGELITLEMGKTLASAKAEVEKCALTCNFYAENASAFLSDEKIVTETNSYVRYLPLGVILAIMPWNFPFWQAFRFIAPTLMAGNTCVLKHASNVPQCALALEEILVRAGAPVGTFQTLLISSDRVAPVIQDPRIAAVTLTGSEGAGARVASVAGTSLKKCVLELGGNDPFIVLPSAKLDRAVPAAVKSRMMANGQSCVCAKRFIVHSAIYDKFEREFTKGVQALRIGDPMLANTDIGPLATADAVDTVEQQVNRSIAAGARLVAGGKRIDQVGNFYMPTVLADIPLSAPVYAEEVFAPVAMLFKVNSLDEAIDLANNTPFGLGSSIWTEDAQERDRAVTELDAGQTFVNSIVASDPRLPFGGIKLSGYGRELGALGIREFTNIKTVSIARDGW